MDAAAPTQTKLQSRAPDLQTADPPSRAARSLNTAARCCEWMADLEPWIAGLDCRPVLRKTSKTPARVFGFGAAGRWLSLVDGGAQIRRFLISI